MNISAYILGRLYGILLGDDTEICYSSLQIECTQDLFSNNKVFRGIRCSKNNNIWKSVHLCSII